MHVGRAFEDLVRGAYDSIMGRGSSGGVSVTLALLCSRLIEIAPDYDPRLLEEVSDLLRRLRNVSTRERPSLDFAKIRARLSTELLFATANYFSVLNKNGLIVAPSSEAIAKRDLTIKGTAIRGEPGQLYFFGLDGDDTGRELEQLFQQSKDETPFRTFSKAINKAVSEVTKSLKEAPIKGNVIFSSGDDILFKGAYDAAAIDALRSTYARISGGHTCSIGFGRTPRETYVALKIAKATPGKNSIVGVDLS
jgi:hypothetical protein